MLSRFWLGKGFDWLVEKANSGRSSCVGTGLVPVRTADSHKGCPYDWYRQGFNPSGRAFRTSPCPNTNKR